MKTVYFKNRFRGHPYHSLYSGMFAHPPSGFHLLMDDVVSRKGARLVNINRILQESSAINGFWQNAKPLFYTLWQSYNRSMQRFDVDIVFAMQQLIFAKIPWTVDLEFADALVGYGNIRTCGAIVRKSLSSPFCRKIMPWSNWSEKTLLLSMNCEDFKRKIEVVRPAVEPKKTCKRNKPNLRLLFVGSNNPSNINNFELKGGFEVLEAFENLNQTYDEIELVVRSRVPPSAYEKYSKLKNIHFYPDPLKERELAELYASSDIFLFPSHSNLGVATLEAMSFGIPVIATSLYDVPEAISDMKTGILLNPHPKIPYYTWNLGPNHFDPHFFDGIRKYRPQLVKQIVDKTSLLIEDETLRQKLGREAREQTETGIFSMEYRNKQLETILNE